jgi:hypothetical protein
MPPLTRKSLFCIIVALFVIGCCPQISFNGKHLGIAKIKAGRKPDGLLFRRLVQKGFDYEAYFLPSSASTALLALQEPTGNTTDIFQLQVDYRGDNPLRHLTSAAIIKLISLTPDNISIDPNQYATDVKFADLPTFYDKLDQLQTFCSVVNSSPGLSYRLYPVVTCGDPDHKTTYHFAIFIQRDSCAQSSVVKVGDSFDVLPNTSYHLSGIKCLPDGFTDSLVANILNGNPTWFRPPTPDKPKPKPTAADTLTEVTFRYTCDPANDFEVNLYRNKAGDIKSIGVINLGGPRALIFQKEVAVSLGATQIGDYTLDFDPTKADKTKPDTVRLIQGPSGNSPDTLLSLHLSELKRSYLLKSSDGTDSIELQPHFAKDKTPDSVGFNLYSYPEYSYPYDPLFDEGSFLRWFKGKYATASADLCSGDIAFQIHLRDSSFFHCVLCNTSHPDSAGAAAKKDTSATKKKNRLVNPGTVTILPSTPYILTPSSIQRYMPVDLQLSGNFDSTACQVPFAMKFGNLLSNHFKPVDTIVTIGKQAWDSAMTLRHGRIRIEIAVKFDSTVDSLARMQEDYLVINDTVHTGGKKVIRLMNFNPSSVFWLEVGTNFELLNSITPHNIYGGIILFEKDVATAGNIHFSIIGGAYESLTSSTGSSSDSGVIYRNNVSFTLDPTHNGYPVYRDTGTVTISAVTHNIGLFFEPAIRLTDLPANHNGAHMFVSFYNELLWQTVTTSNDYSHLARDSSLTHYLPTPDSLKYYHFRQNSSVTDDFRASYLGFGFPFYLKRNAYTLFLNPVFGYTNQHFTPIRPYSDPHQLSQVYKYPLDSIPSGYPITYLQPKHRWNPFYVIQLRFNEEKYDISVTGEIRTLLLRNAAPLLTLTISKKFDLASLVKSVVSPAAKTSTN